MIRNRLLFMLVLLAYLVLVTSLTWSRLDQQYMMDIGVTAAFDLTILGGPVPAAIIAACMAMFFRPEDNPWRRLGPVPTILLAIAAVSLLWTNNYGATLFFLVQLAMTYAAAMISIRLLGIQTTLRVAWYYTSVVILLSVALAASGDPHGLMQGMHDGLWRGLFPHKNNFGPFLVANICLALYGREVGGFPRVTQLPMIAIDVVALVFARSSTATLAAAGVAVMLLLFMPVPNATLRRMWRVVTIILLAGIAAIGLTNPVLVTTLVGKDPTLSHRTQMWAAATDLTMSRPLGTGYGTSGGSQASIEIQKVVGTERSQTVQSGYINMALELGWAPVALLVGWLLYLVATGIFDNRRDPLIALLSALIVLHLMVSIAEVNGGISPRLNLFLILTLLAQMRGRLIPQARANRGSLAIRREPSVRTE